MRPTSGSKQNARLPRAFSGLGVTLGLSLGVSLGATALMLTTGFSAVAETVKPPPAAAAAHVEGPLLTGFWQAYNDDGRPGGVFYFYEKNGFYEGRLVKAVTYPEEPPDDPLCKACTGEKKNQPMMGLVIVYGMKRHGAAKYEDGHILDPRDGKVWSAELDVTPDNKKLNLRGYIGTPLLGQTRVWTRLPDETMAPADIPGEPIAALGGVQGKKPVATPAAAPAAKPAASKAQ